jgi:DNA-binding NtrC family response regulator
MTSLTQQKALIIHDDFKDCRLLAATLNLCNFKTMVAHSLRQGKSYFKDWHPSLVFLDQELYDGPGVELIPEIRAFDRSIMIVVITADISGALGQKAFGEENIYFLSRPFTIAAIQDLMHAICKYTTDPAIPVVVNLNNKNLLTGLRYL